MRKNKGFQLAVGMLFVISLLGIFAPWIAPHDPLAVNFNARFAPPSKHYWFGADHLGRCVLSRLLYGIRVSVLAAMLIMVLTLVISVPIALIVGYVRGRADHFLMRLIDSTLAIPDIVLTIAIVGLLGPGFFHLVFAIVIVRWASYVRFIRSFVIKISQEDYILSARMSGNSHARILWRHLLPQLLVPLAVFSALDMGKIVLHMAALSFLGLGTQPPVPEWGVMLHDATSYFQLAPHVMLFPGLAILLFVLACQYISEYLQQQEEAR